MPYRHEGWNLPVFSHLISFGKEDKLLVIFFFELQAINLGYVSFVIVGEVIIVWQTDNVCFGNSGAVTLLSSRKNAVVCHIHSLTIICLEHFRVVFVITIKEGYLLGWQT